jgi:hypothetical protein
MDIDDKWEDLAKQGVTFESHDNMVVMAKLGKTIEAADRTASIFNQRILWLTVVMATLAIVQCWPIIAGWFRG